MPSQTTMRTKLAQEYRILLSGDSCGAILEKNIKYNEKIEE